MNIVLKTIEEVLKQKRLTKIQKKRLEKTKEFSKKFDIKIKYKNIDFLVFKILEKNVNLLEIERNLNIVYGYTEILENGFLIDNVKNKIVLFNKFYIIYAGLSFSEQKRVYNIYDKDKNKIGQIVLKNKGKLKKNHNVIDSLELSGLFFKCYYEYIEKFFIYFGIQKSDNDIIKRLDYCIDVEGIEVYELLDFLKDIEKKSKGVNGLSSTDKKRLAENNSDYLFGKKEVYKNFLSNDNDLKVYDKILDIIDNYMKRKVDGKNPYDDYINSDFPITRIELKKKRFKNLRNNSIEWVFQNIEALFFDYLLRFFEIDLSMYIGLNNTLNGKKIFLAKEVKSKKFFYSVQMFLAYGKNIMELAGEEELYKIIFKNFPGIEKTTSLQLMDEFESWELLNELFKDQGQKEKE